MNDPLDAARQVPGELNYRGYDSTGMRFSFDAVLRAIGSLDGDRCCGLHFQRGTELSHQELVAFCNENPDHTGERPIKLTGGTFCVGGGGTGGFICHVYTPGGPVWASTARGNPDTLHEVAYDSGCDTVVGIFPGNFVLSQAEVIDIARDFFRFGQMANQYDWIRHAELGFDPWCAD